MVLGYVVIIIFVVILYYAASNENTQFAATASAIRQIWSGGCRLSCRPSNVSGLHVQESSCQARASRDDCVCDTCPCAMIENLLRTCSPATRMYTNISEVVSHYYYNLSKSITEVYEYATRVLECRTACQRQPQVLIAKDSSDNFSPNDQKKEKTRSSTKMPKCNRSALNLSKKSSISFKEPLASESEETVSTGAKSKVSESVSKTSDNSKDSDVTLKASESNTDCSKCVEEGKPCVRDCPRAKHP